MGRAPGKETLTFGSLLGSLLLFLFLEIPGKGKGLHGLETDSNQDSEFILRPYFGAADLCESAGGFLRMNVVNLWRMSTAVTLPHAMH